MTLISGQNYSSKRNFLINCIPRASAKGRWRSWSKHRSLSTLPFHPFVIFFSQNISKLQEKETAIAKRKRKRKFVWSLKQDKFEAAWSFNKKLTVILYWILNKCNCLLVLFKHSVDVWEYGLTFESHRWKRGTNWSNAFAKVVFFFSVVWFYIWILEKGSRGIKVIAQWISYNPKSFSYPCYALLKYTPKECLQSCLDLNTKFRHFVTVSDTIFRH